MISRVVNALFEQGNPWDECTLRWGEWRHKVYDLLGSGEMVGLCYTSVR